MAIVNQPTPLSNELAWNGDKNPIPDTNDGSKGLFSVEYGFPYVTQQPLAQGGIPPQRNDFNGVLNLLSKFIRYFQNGGVFAYNASMDYSVGMLVRSGDRLYVCKAENGANTTAGVQGVSNSNYWNEITLEDTLDNTLVNQLKTVLVTEAKTAGNTTDWNNLTESRTHKISGATFSSTYHQPVGASGNGELVVLKNGTDTIVQVYYANSVQASQAGAFHRIYFNGAWTEWVYDITNKGGKIDGSLTLSGDLTADNITANGDLSVTGNSTINGKLTVDEVQVTDKLLIGEVDPANPDTSNFLTKDDLQKIQDQIIAPEDRKYVDSINGSDEVGDGTSTKPFRTVNKAVSMLNTQVKNIYIILNNEVAGKTYEMTAIDYKELGTRWENLNIGVSDWNAVVNNNRKPILKINEGKAYHSNQTTSDKIYYYKGKICAIVPNISIKGVDIEIISEDTESGVAFVCNNLTFSFNNIKLLTSNLVVPLSNLDNTLFIDRDVNINGSNYLVANTFNVFLEDATNKTPINLGDVVYNTILKSNTNVTISEDNKKIATGIHPLYTNII